MLEEYPTNSDGLVIANGTWTYKIPTVDTIPKQFNVEILNSGNHKNRVLSSKGKFKTSNPCQFFSILNSRNHCEYSLIEQNDLVLLYCFLFKKENLNKQFLHEWKKINASIGKIGKHHTYCKSLLSFPLQLLVNRH